MGLFAFRSVAIASLLAAISVPALAQTPGPEPYQEFVRGLSVATARDAMGRPGAAVRDPAAFEAMRGHLLSMYRGMSATSTFVRDGQVFDCVPIAEQPSVRLQGLTEVDTAPSEPAPGAKPAGTPDADDAATPSSATDACADGTIPFRRITLEEVARFGTLRDFFAKEPHSEAETPFEAAPPVAATHKYAHAAQTVANRGSSSALDVWDPPINVANGQIFSLSQQWLAGFAGATVQTAEVGWQKYPGKYAPKAKHSVLFIYWTADGYKATGCYNLDCPAFVQTNKKVMLGATFDKYSTAGARREVSLGYYFTANKWWLGVNGKYIGYYPAKLYGAGPLSKSAQRIDFGGETVGATTWPAMGSGKFAVIKNKVQTAIAAYQDNIVYRDLAGKRHAPKLVGSITSPKCYNISPTLLATPPINTIFFFGGPGGGGC